MDMRLFKISDVEYAAFLLYVNELRKYARKCESTEDLEIITLIYSKKLMQHGYHVASRMMREIVFTK